MAQLVEQRIRNAWVTSSSLVIGSLKVVALQPLFLYYYCVEFMKSKIIVIALLLLSLSTWQSGVLAQVYCGEHTYDGEHKNEVEGYLQGGRNSVYKFFLGPVVSYKRHITERVYVSGAVDMPFGKSRYGVYAQGGYRLPIGKFNVYANGKLMYNRYMGLRTNELCGNVSVMLEAPYFDVILGEAIVHYRLLGSHYTEPHTPQYGAGVNIRPRWNSWNIGIFVRNHDDFYFENWNINWGVRFNASLQEQMKLFGEVNIRPAGSISQLATKYESSLKLGLKYVW